MRVSHLSLTSWRNYQRAELELPSGVSVLLGRNGQGKTNLVEAIGYLSTLASHRVSAPVALIRAGDDAAVVRARLVNGDREVRVELQLNRDRPNVAQLGGSAVKPRELTRYCHSVVFAPEDLGIVRGDPSERRRFIDTLLMQLSPRLAGVMSDYERVVKQRNTLLKTARLAENLSALEVWNDKLIQLGSELIRERARLVSRLQGPLVASYRSIVDAEHSPAMRWEYSWGGAWQDDVEGRFRVALAEVERAERDRAVTLVGPHRDELVLELNSLPVKGYASHGESWSFVLALKLAAIEVLREDSLVGDPVVLLDDVFAELDRGRRDRLAAAIGGYEQVIITAAVAEDVPAELRAYVQGVRAGTLVDAAELP